MGFTYIYIYIYVNTHITLIRISIPMVDCQRIVTIIPNHPSKLFARAASELMLLVSTHTMEPLNLKQDGT